jgi:GNAT superfamily N-acetyltransferase
VSQLHIRPATPSDARHIAAIKLESWREAYAKILRPETLARLNLQEETAKQLDRIHSQEHFFVSTTPVDTPVAYAHWIQLPLSAQVERGSGGEVKQSIIQADWPYLNILAALYVHPNHYRQGHGTTLISACAQLAYSLGHQGMMIGVFRANTRAHELYSKLGATLFRAGHFEVDGTDYPDFLLRFDHLGSLIELNNHQFKSWSEKQHQT